MVNEDEIKYFQNMVAADTDEVAVGGYVGELLEADCPCTLCGEELCKVKVGVCNSCIYNRLHPGLRGEVCSLCGAQALHKVAEDYVGGEVTDWNSSLPGMSAYLCKQHFTQLMTGSVLKAKQHFEANNG